MTGPDESLNILYYVQTFPKLSESFVLNEIYELEQRGHDVAVFAHGGDTDLTHEEFSELKADVGYAERPGIGDLPDLISPKTLSPHVLSEVYARVNPLRLSAHLHRAIQCDEFLEANDFEPDVVHSHFASVPTISGRYVAAYYDVPHTVTTHAFDLYDDVNDHFLNFYLDGAGHIITISEYNRDHIIERTDTPVSIVRAGIRPEKFTPSTDENVVADRLLTVARLDEKKGLTDAIDAVASLRDRGVDVDYHIIGKGPLREQLEDKIDALGLDDQIQLLGHVSDGRLTIEYEEAACFVLPSVIAESGDRDGIPVVLMEAMATETPAVSTTVSGIPELIHNGENGLLAPPNDPSALANQLQSLLESPTRRRELGAAARETVAEEFNIATEAGKLEEVFVATSGGVLDETQADSDVVDVEPS